MSRSILHKTAGALALLPWFQRGKQLFADNSVNWNLRLSKLDKLVAGTWLILNDYSKGVFPPQFLDQQKAYQAEKDYRYSIPGMTPAEVALCGMTKPFWGGKPQRACLRHFDRIIGSLERVNLQPPARLLELGCGSGWMAEFLATMGFSVTGTTISEEDIADATRRIQSLEVKGLAPDLHFLAVPMESVHTAVPRESFDAALIYEALHHAFDWREALHSCFMCLRPHGWLLICSEPNLLHTFVSYRMAKLSNTHEIGFSRSALTTELRRVGFRSIVSTGAKLHCWFQPHWLLARK